MKIGYVLKKYPEKRCIINKTNNDYIYYNLKRNIQYIIKSVLNRVGLYNVWNLKGYINIKSDDVDLWHTFNAVVRSNKPFIITFESAVPRNNETIERRWEWDNRYKSQTSNMTKNQITMLYKTNLHAFR